MLSMSIPTYAKPLASQVINRPPIRTDNPKARVTRPVLIRIPEDMRAPECLTRDLLPIALSARHAGHAVAELVPTDRLPRFCDPDPGARLDAMDDVSCCLDGCPEGVPHLDGRRALPVRVAVHADEVGGVNDGLICWIDPERALSLLYIFGGCLGQAYHAVQVSTCPTSCVTPSPLTMPLTSYILACEYRSRRLLAVEILAADGDGQDPAGAVCVDGSYQCILFCLIVRCVLRPDADEEIGTGRERGGHGVGEGSAI